MCWFPCFSCSPEIRLDDFVISREQTVRHLLQFLRKTENKDTKELKQNVSSTPEEIQFVGKTLISLKHRSHDSLKNTQNPFREPPWTETQLKFF